MTDPVAKSFPWDDSNHDIKGDIRRSMNYMLQGAQTGRMSSKRPNMAQLPTIQFEWLDVNGPLIDEIYVTERADGSLLVQAARGLDPAALRESVYAMWYAQKEGKL